MTESVSREEFNRFKESVNRLVDTLHWIIINDVEIDEWVQEEFALAVSDLRAS